MAIGVDHPVFDGTTGRGDYGGRRTHIIRLLRDAKEALTVDQVAAKVGLPASAVRYHLESLADAGLATREAQPRTTPGRPKVAYRGVLPNQTHEREQGFRLLAETMAVAIASSNQNAGEWMYRVGREWGRQLMGRAASDSALDDEAIIARLVDKLDALWFAPELVDGESPKLVLFNCPFLDSTRRFPQVICQLHAGMINGALEEMASNYRLSHLTIHAGHRCDGHMTRTTARLPKVPLEVVRRPDPTP